MQNATKLVLLLTDKPNETNKQSEQWAINLSITLSIAVYNQLYYIHLGLILKSAKILKIDVFMDYMLSRSVNSFFLL